MKKIFDISPIIAKETAVFPGDKEFSRSVALSFSNGNHLELSSIETTLHIGAHTDAPSHYHKDGLDIASVNLERYIGPCQVIELSIDPSKRITKADFKDKVLAKKVLFKTMSFPNPYKWSTPFNSIDSDLIHWLSDQEVHLIGIDTPSVDPHDSKTLEAHQAIYTRNMSILEGIDLSQVNAGLYELISLPLKIKNADASPVRAILREI
ncbi:MAG: cyclase family protein [Oligoflexia bacterium]|nr:cyclase family protein [Oligoflexia bacterium]